MTVNELDKAMVKHGHIVNKQQMFIKIFLERPHDEVIINALEPDGIYNASRMVYELLNNSQFAQQYIMDCLDVMTRIKQRLAENGRTSVVMLQ